MASLFKCECGKEYSRKDWYENHISSCQVHAKADPEIRKTLGLDAPPETPTQTLPERRPGGPPTVYLNKHAFGKDVYLAQDAGPYFILYCKYAFIAVVLEQASAACECRLIAMQQLINRNFLLVFEKKGPLPKDAEIGGQVAQKAKV